MRMPMIGMVLVAGLAAGCGSQSPAEQVRATEVKALEALTSDHPERACQYMTGHDRCIEAMAAVKVLKMDARAVAGLPDDWRARLKHAKVVVRGSTATLSAGATGKVVRFVHRQGRWLAVSS